MSENVEWYIAGAVFAVVVFLAAVVYAANWLVRFEAKYRLEEMAAELHHQKQAVKHQMRGAYLDSTRRYRRD